MFRFSLPLNLLRLQQLVEGILDAGERNLAEDEAPVPVIETASALIAENVGSDLANGGTVAYLQVLFDDLTGCSDQGLQALAKRCCQHIVDAKGE